MRFDKCIFKKQRIPITIKKFLSAILCFALLLSFPTAYAAAGSAKQYPFVFVHGMMGWGEAQGIDSLDRKSVV